MDSRDRKEVATIVKKLKGRARGSPWVPFGLLQEHRHSFSNGLSLCLTMDTLPKEYMNLLARAIGVKLTEELAEDSQWWHLSITRLTPGGPSPKEIGFWCRAFFKEEPTVEMPGPIIGANARHFFWRTK